MRLKTMDGPLSVHNGNNDILNSPKRINTIQNSNVTSGYNTTTYSTTSDYDNTLGNITINETIKDLHISDLNILNNVVQDKVQWCNPSQQEVQNREIAANNANRNCHNNKHLVNINNTLAATLGQQVRRHGTASSLCSPAESSPDDSFLDFEEAQQSCSSADISPQDEDRAFDISDSDQPKLSRLQHLAHTLISDPDFTDDDTERTDYLESDALTAKLEAEANNNNNVEDTDYKIDSVNRLDSVENIQKVFYDKAVFNVQENSEFYENSESSSGNANNSDEDTEIRVSLNIEVEEKGSAADNIVGDFSREVHAELGRVALGREDIFEDPHQPPTLETAVVQELEEAVEKLQVIKDLKPPATKYNIEPNIEQPFNKLSPTKQIALHQVLEDTAVIKNPEAMAILQENMPFSVKLDDTIKMKIEDAFLSNATENVRIPLAKENVFLDLNLMEDLTKEYKEKDDDSAVPRKKEKMDTSVKRKKDYNQQYGSLITFPRRDNGSRNRDPINRRSVPMAREKKRNSEALGSFDVYNIETAMPKIDLEAIEYHLRAAREEERRLKKSEVINTILDLKTEKFPDPDEINPESITYVIPQMIKL
ncbi:hypothetical protein JTB14_015538 [Gonioctena quinquepunctata]|nr:hypothetical protein JTB14_015538 [Gonioctena quinquepunctata]